jgi:hypothetical protein
MTRHTLPAALLYLLIGTVVATASGFKPPVNYGVGTYPDSIAAGDFNRDGKLDLAVANYSDVIVSVLLGNGNGTFQPRVDYAVEYGGSSVAVGDLNNDGKLDLVVTAVLTGVDVLMGNGDGTFQPYLAYPTAYGPYSVAVADFNGDGKADLATANYAVGGFSVSVLLGNGDGSFQPHVEYGSGGSRSIVAADFNADGKPDLGGADTFGNTVSVYLGNGDGTFQPPVAYAAGTQPDTVALGDFNLDGKPDLATANEVSTFSILLGNGDGTFQPPLEYPTLYGQSLAVADFNGDKRDDLAIAHFQYPFTVGVLLGNGDGTFQSELQYTTGAYPNAVAVSDLDPGGAEDLMTADGYFFSRRNDGGDVISILLNTGGTLLKTTSSVNPSTLRQPVTFTTTVRSGLKGVGTPTGKVTFMDGALPLGSGVLVNGQANFTTSRLKGGTHQIRAQYSGDSTFNPHQGEAIPQKVMR